MKTAFRTALLLLVAMSTLSVVNRATAQPGQAGGNLVGCPWFREVTIYGTFPGLCNEWTRDNNLGVIQANGIPSPDSLDGTAFRITRDYCCSDESKIWQIVKSPGGLRLHFSMFHQVPLEGDLTVRIYGRDYRYGVGGWALVWTPVNMQAGDNVWRLTEGKMVMERPYNFYMVEIIGHVPGDIGTTGAALTGVYFSVSGSQIHLPIVVGGQ